MNPIMLPNLQEAQIKKDPRIPGNLEEILRRAPHPGLLIFQMLINKFLKHQTAALNRAPEERNPPVSDLELPRGFVPGENDIESPFSDDGYPW